MNGTGYGLLIAIATGLTLYAAPVVGHDIKVGAKDTGKAAIVAAEAPPKGAVFLAKQPVALYFRIFPKK